MTTVAELVPGDTVTLPSPGGAVVATFVGALFPHPLWPELAMVIWRMPEGHLIGDWSHDALRPAQDVGPVSPATEAERTAQLRRALLHRSQW